MSDAVRCLLTTDLDAIIIGRHLVTPKTRTLKDIDISKLSVALPNDRRLSVNGDVGHLKISITSCASRFFAPSSVELSEACGEAILGCLKEKSLGHVISAYPRALEENTRKELLDELYDLWKRRAIDILPIT